MTLWPTSKPSSGELKVHRLWYGSLLVLISVGLSAQVPLAGADVPSNKQVIAFLTESIDWYRHCAMKRQVAIDPVDLAFVDAHRQDAAQILQLSFDFARADAQFFADVGAGNSQRHFCFCDRLAGPRAVCEVGKQYRVAEA
jgi:hypothetical protein